MYPDLSARLDALWLMAFFAANADAVEVRMAAERRVRIVRIGRKQAVRIPRDLELPGDQAIMRRDGDRLIIEPAPPAPLLALLETLEPIDEEFAPPPELPIENWLR